MTITEFVDDKDLSVKHQQGVSMKIRPYAGYAINNARCSSCGACPQEQVLLAVMRELSRPASSHLTLDVDGKRAVDEPTLWKLLDAAKEANLLETKQDAWILFRRFRKRLIANGVIEEVFFDPLFALNARMERMRKEKA